MRARGSPNSDVDDRTDVPITLLSAQHACGAAATSQTRIVESVRRQHERFERGVAIIKKQGID